MNPSQTIKVITTPTGNKYFQEYFQFPAGLNGGTQRDAEAIRESSEDGGVNFDSDGGFVVTPTICESM